MVRLNEGCEGFGYTDDAEGLTNPGALPGIWGGNGTITFSKNQTVSFKSLCGIFQQTKYIPLRYCPIEIELELADNDEPIVSTVGTLFLQLLILLNYGILNSAKSSVISYRWATHWASRMLIIY